MSISTLFSFPSPQGPDGVLLLALVVLRSTGVESGSCPDSGFSDQSPQSTEGTPCSVSDRRDTN